LRPSRLISFGYLHPDGSPVPPAADRLEDVRDRLRDPAAARDILDLDGLDPRVQDVVLGTHGAHELLANLVDYADLPAGPAASTSDAREAGTEVLTGLPKDTPS
jgi:RNase adaptor protein for sRNA GlmZ degradation